MRHPFGRQALSLPHAIQPPGRVAMKTKEQGFMTTAGVSACRRQLAW
jgi:hypothetical protein